MGIYHTDTMGDHNIAKRIHKAKKTHECCFCSKPVEKGTKYVKTVGTFDGYFVSNAWHQRCHSDHVGYVEGQRRKE